MESHMLQLQYKFNHDFPSVVKSLFGGFDFFTPYKWNSWGAVAEVKQLDDDRFQILNRHYNLLAGAHSYEQIIVDRATNKIESKTFLGDNYSDVAEKGVYEESDDGVLHNVYVYRANGTNKEMKPKMFKWKVESMLSSIILDKKMEGSG